MSEVPQRSKKLDARSLRGLAHPLRVRVLGLLRVDGPATGAMLAARLGEDRGNISWHLRQLAEHGFITEERDRGTKRERWWRAVHQYTELPLHDFVHDPEVREPLAQYLRAALELDFRRAAAFSLDDWPDPWQEAVEFAGWRLRLSPQRLKEVLAEITATLERVEADGKAEADPDSEDVFIQLQAFPHRGDERASR
ncbi:Helix-turn-helix domain-containing protein [Streptoalloteichus tenebrarius]|uniref:Helix-turn-helix domain-containing protein n=1 Tax=Streptoalloteichus tenebrarius (strain ATCC 17920 / DSM 40477 / JCM 4838 / CBS 697.72 / NBRC 16177 / NCIMB 11028 / NRRL B-12390 / A12253. 1 / ISP 5477) TaxID=1933 RepID=A0ABT1I404_STRSD|nr:helix-turn-helix domain-containing protein [Streptoalloteichus tenebrarius]MCP2262515.1 Helix-turn-helix domain-containing protein [Streptoalloteichus tenebrarius]BFE99112.1 helix-turn-helix domain-containing protein [Streptoalloteichus tenebrarius]